MIVMLTISTGVNDWPPSDIAQLADLLSSSKSVCIFRTFDKQCMRILLLKQLSIVALSQQIDDLELRVNGRTISSSHGRSSITALRIGEREESEWAFETLEQQLQRYCEWNIRRGTCFVVLVTLFR